MRFGSQVGLATIVVALGVAGPAAAQVKEEGAAGLQFNFSLPGARSLGMGGAFLGLADDATSALANPAGLVNLSRPEVTAEGRSFRFTHRFTNRGHDFGDPSGRGTDTIAGLRLGEATDSATALSFLSFTWARPRWSVAVYRHQLLDFQSDFASQGAFRGSFPFVARLFPIQSTADLKIANYGVSGAYRVTEKLSLGLGLQYLQYQGDTQTLRYAIAPSSTFPTQSFFGPPNFDPRNLRTRETVHGDDHGIGWSVGALWHPLEPLSIGVTYRHGAKFDSQYVLTPGPAIQPFAPVTAKSEFRVPDIYGLGISARPSDRWTVNFDVVRVEYSDLSDALGISPAAGFDADQIRLDDGVEVRFGVEYAFAELRHPFFVRAGAWRDPAHVLRFENTGELTPVEAVFGQMAFSPGDIATREYHGSVGFGWVVGSFQVDAAYDFSRSVDTASLSAVFRF
ncbi:MAG: outer membrane protein transport protein [Thermoanaerobaculia bacterium]